ncbi:MAG TPA: saccharopine dehydrogenase NADP-binding domain-containing protein [Leptolyngbyaceae cyanobacterium]
MSKTFLILGGYGNTGKLIADLLLKETEVQLILAGRNLAKAKFLANKLNHQFNSDRVFAIQVDAADANNLKNAFAKTDFVIVASSTSEYVKNVAEAAIHHQIDYLDIQVSASKHDILKSLQDDIVQANCCFITDGGFHPGLASVLVRYAVPYFDTLETANLAGLIRENWQQLSFSDATWPEFLSELKHFPTIFFQNGDWQNIGWQTKIFDFGTEFGKQPCFPMLLEEMRFLPAEISSLKEMGFYIAGFNWFVDYVVFSLAIPALNIWPKTAIGPIAKMMVWGLNTFSQPPYRTILLLEASGWKNEQFKTMRVQLEHQNGYLLTAIPVVACLLQYLDGSIKKPGLWWQGNIVEPNQMLEDIRRLGVNVEIKK